MQKGSGPKFIAFSGKKQTGKDCSANFCYHYLQNRGHSVAITYFAAPLKEFCISVLGLPRTKVYGSDSDKNELTHIKWDTLPNDIRLKYAKPNPIAWLAGNVLIREGFMTIREVLQIVGTDIVREMLWNEAWATYPFRQQYDSEVVLLPDLRFPNELAALEKAKGLVIRLNRNTGLVDNHPSEIALDNISFANTFDNNGSLAELDAFLTKFLEQNIL